MFPKIRKAFLEFKPKRKKEKDPKKENDPEDNDSESSRHSEVGEHRTELAPAVGPAASITKATSSSKGTLTPMTSSASMAAGTSSSARGAAICNSQNREIEKENLAQSVILPKDTTEDISQGTHSHTSAPGGHVTLLPNMATPLSPNQSKARGVRTGSEISGGEAAPVNADVREDGEVWYCEIMPVWNQAVQEWRKNHPKDFDKYTVNSAGWDWLTEVKPANKTPTQAAARIKRWQPVLTSLRVITMAIAALDPHKIAPVVCGSIFGGLDVLLNVMNPEDRDKILDTLCQCGNTIKECNTFELTFFKASYPTIEDNMVEMRELLKQQYSTALIFACKVRKGCEDMQVIFMHSDEYRKPGPRRNAFISWFAHIGDTLWHKLSNEVLEWEGGLKELLRLKYNWAVRKEAINEYIALDGHTVTVRKWLRKEGYPDPSPRDIRSRVTPDGLYSDGADWFIEGSAFNTFSAGFNSPDSPDNTGVKSTVSDGQDECSAENSQDSQVMKQVLWLRGGLGTGKTTVLSLVFANLSTLEGPVSKSENLVRIIPYFCNASEAGAKRPDCETIIRAMIRRMALQSNGTLAKDANDFYFQQQSSAQIDGELTLEEHWYPLFKKLITRSGSHFVFLVDALDECEKPTDWEKLLKFMKDVTQSCTNVSFICSSHSHVRVDRAFQDKSQATGIVAIEDMSEGRNRKALGAYINGEIERRRADAGENVFYSSDCAELLENLRDTLIRNARGVFQWAKIWLNILLAVEDVDRMAIKSETDAQRWLIRLQEDSRDSKTDYDLLTNGYQRLWNITCIRGRDEFDQRGRLFHFVLAAEKEVTTELLSEVLRVRADKFDRSPQPDAVMRLCSNFLMVNREKKTLEFVHSSALKFIRNLNVRQDKLVEGDENKIAEGDEDRFFSDHRNHESIATLYMDLVGSKSHPYWIKTGIKGHESGWHYSEMTSMVDFLRVGEREGDRTGGQTAKYFTTHGLTHFVKTARQRSLNDPIWRSFIRRLAQSSDSAFGLFLLCNRDSVFSTIYHVFPESSSGSKEYMNEGMSCLYTDGRQLRVLTSHVLACLPVFDEYEYVSTTSTHNIVRPHKDAELLVQSSIWGGQIDRLKSQGSFPRPSPRVSALHLACQFGNAGAVCAILDAATLVSAVTLSDMLHSRSVPIFPLPRFAPRLQSSPLKTAISYGNVTIGSMLLRADRQRLRGNVEPGSPEDRSPTYVSTQWELVDGNNRESILVHALSRLKDDDVKTLLNVARPMDINARYGKKQKTLLEHAADRSKDWLVDIMIVDYGADTTFLNLQSSKDTKM